MKDNYVEFDQNKFNAVLNEYNKIIVAKRNIEDILGIKYWSDIK